MLNILAAPFAACLIIAALHCYLGLHIIRRGVIFVDLALAQMAALGSAVALLVAPMVLGPEGSHHHENAVDAQAEIQAAQTEMGEEENPREEALAYAMSVGFAFLGAALFSVGRFKDNRVPHEAIIGIVYVVSAALAMLVLNKTAHGGEKLEEMMTGNILFVNWEEVMKLGVLYFALAVPHWIWRDKFLAISGSVSRAESSGINVRWFDFVFYAIFGVMVTESVKIGGVLVVFSFLIIPAVCAAILFRRFALQLWFGWGVALLASIGGLWFSAAMDMPTGSSLVAAFGTALAICALVNRLRPSSSKTE